MLPMMIKKLAIQTVCILTLSAAFSHAMAENDLSNAEANTMIKEDIASTQVMSELCPTLMGKNAQFDGNVQQLITASLGDYAGAKMTFAQLQADSEYQALLAETRNNAKNIDAAEQKSACDDILNYAP